MDFALGIAKYEKLHPNVPIMNCNKYALGSSICNGNCAYKNFVFMWQNEEYGNSNYDDGRYSGFEHVRRYTENKFALM